MKILVDKMPEYSWVAEQCLFTEKTGSRVYGIYYSYIDECECKISGRICELQLDGECPYLKEQNNERDFI